MPRVNPVREYWLGSLAVNKESWKKRCLVYMSKYHTDKIQHLSKERIVEAEFLYKVIAAFKLMLEDADEVHLHVSTLCRWCHALLVFLSDRNSSLLLDCPAEVDHEREDGLNWEYGSEED